MLTPIRERILQVLSVFESDDEHLVKASADTLTSIVAKEGDRLGREFAEPLYDRIGWQCTCTCKAHGVHNCAECLNSQGCPIHSDFELDQVDKAALLDAQETAFNLLDELAIVLGLDKSLWGLLDEHVRLALIEACRRVVTSGVAATVQSEMARIERIRHEQMRGD